MGWVSVKKLGGPGRQQPYATQYGDVTTVVGQGAPLQFLLGGLPFRPGRSGSSPSAPAARQPPAWRFTNVTKQAGVAEPGRSFPAWFWDYNNDGWEDLLVAPYYTEELGDIARVHLKSPSRIVLRWCPGALAGCDAERPARDPPVSSGGSFGANSLQLEVGLGQATALPEVEIRWPSGKRQVLKELPLRHRIEIREGDDHAKIVALRPARWAALPAAPNSIGSEFGKARPRTLGPDTGRTVRVDFRNCRMK